jgi:hypothetical protein
MNKVKIDEFSVPSIYINDPNVNNLTYSKITFTKYEADEKDISEVYLKKEDKRIGWLIPLLSLTSTDHDYSNNQYFQKHAYELFKIIKNNEYDERTYFLIVSDRLLEDSLSIDDLSLSFLEYGIFPLREDIASFHSSSYLEVQKKTSITPSFNIKDSQKFISSLIFKTLPSEENLYARFMLIYQAIELSMELVFYRRISKYKENKNHLGNIRDKISEISSEQKLISLLYNDAGINKYDKVLSDKARNIFGNYKDENYYTKTNRSTFLYHLRNTIVHSYHKFDMENEMKFLCESIEMDFYKILKYFYSSDEFKSSITSEHL